MGGRPERGGELAALGWLARRLGSGPEGEVWVGDDAAVLAAPAGPLLLATDLLAEGVHFDRRLESLADVGWKALVANVSDVAAMGGRPLAAVVALAGASRAELEELYEGLVAAAECYGCPVVGGDLSDAPALVVSVAILGTTDGRPAVRRSGARPGDALYVTGPLGAASAGLRLLRRDPASTGPLVAAHRRPSARLAEGRAAARAGASAMIDVSDGLGLDLERLASASAVGVALDDVPVAPGATLEDALGGGEDYELCLAAAPGVLEDAFAAAGLALPLRIGRVVADARERSLRGEALPVLGYEHRLA
ncbi:MAG TPA: thiamine-phosphate kinase [Acidimicrobiales bacterium]|nr:thiamine-phosphate kinase [Acidimicrobiales bacterium]